MQPYKTNNATTNRQKKKPAAQFSTFGFPRNTSRPFPKPKDLKFFNTLLHYRNLFIYLPIFVKSKCSILKTIGTTLRELREEKGLFLREVGAKLSLDPTILSKIEQDKRMPTKEQVKALAAFYKQQKKDVIIAWLSDKLFYEVQDEDLALQAMRVAEEKIRYNIKDKKRK